MNYYSTNGKAPLADLHKAVVKGLAEDRGLYMPEVIHKLPKAFLDDMPKMRFQDIAFNVASAFFGDDVDLDALQDLVYWIYVLEYVPVALLLCRCYERTNSIWSCIFFHMMVNGVAVNTLSALQELL